MHVSGNTYQEIISENTKKIYLKYQRPFELSPHVRVTLSSCFATQKCTREMWRSVHDFCGEEGKIIKNGFFSAHDSDIVSRNTSTMAKGHRVAATL